MMKFYKVNVILLGTVVGSGFNKMGEVITDMIVHVDPDNTKENGRYKHPIVTEDVMKKLKANGFIDKSEEVDLDDVKRWALGLDDGASALITRDTEAERHAENMEADESVPGPTALSTRDTTNFPDRDLVAGDIAGKAPVDTSDAAPAPTTRTPAKPAKAATTPAA
jgi:hypothetical protein